MPTTYPLAKDRIHSTLDTYFHDIANTPLLSAEEEKQLAREIAQGNREARDRMIQANLGLVIHITKYYTGRGLPLADLIEEGNLGLMCAVDRFDPNLGYRFSTYATISIKRSMRRAIADTARMIRIPDHFTSDWQKASLKLQAQSNDHLSDVEIRNYLGIPRETAKYMLSTISVGHLVNHDDGEKGERSFEDWLADKRLKDPAEELDMWEELRKLRELIEMLKPRERNILQMRYGLDGQIPETLDELGTKFGISKERVRQIEKKAMEKLRKRMAV
jgi:RNA polymerase primary sigma factor